jgi:spoIIIJ-associated protein
VEAGSAGTQGPSSRGPWPQGGEASSAAQGSGDDAPAGRVEALLQHIATAASLRSSVVVREDDEHVVGEFVGEDAESLIADHGRTIDAIQHLAYRTAFGASTPRKAVVVDAAGYRARRATALRAAADQAVETAVREGRAVELEPMSAIERKLVHEHLRDRREVETYSEGEEPARRLVVAPLVDRPRA